MMKIRNPDCEGCNFYDRSSGLCGFCMKKILKEVKENMNGGGENGPRQIENESYNEAL